MLLTFSVLLSICACSAQEPEVKECTTHVDKNTDGKCDVCKNDMPEDDPTEDDPTEDDPTEDDPAEDDPTADDPTADDPTADDPTADDPTADDPTTDDPTADDPTADDPTSDDPTTDDPTKDDPTADDPTADDPTADDPTTDDPTKDDPTTNEPIRPSIDPSEPHRHVPSNAYQENYVAPTCTEEGYYDSVVYCVYCGVEMMRERTILSADHTPTKELICSGCGEEVPYFRDGKYIYFGHYPQTLKAKNVIITNEIDDRGYYLGRDGYYYAKVAAMPFDLGYKFSDGSIVMNHEVFYFKVEPIRWRILEEKDGSFLLFCDSVIANISYDESSNNYKESDMRVWLNDDFYNQAFTSEQMELIQQSTVDNSASSTGYSGNPHISVATIDKVFLLSYREATNGAYGFAANLVEDVMRRIMTSDYSRATGVYMETEDPDEYGNGLWRLRSPDYLYSNLVECVNYIGLVGRYDYCYSSYVGVVPALRITV